jgi:hypothetical protein
MRSLRAFVIVAVLFLAFPLSAGAHGAGGEASGFTSTVAAVTPAVQGLDVEVLDADDRLMLRNGTGREVVVLGYDGEPYLRFDAGSVYRNVRSPAGYLNADRYAQKQVPASANPEAAPVWRRITLGHSYEWHDHRIQWMSTIAPDEIRAEPDTRRHVFDWSVPITVDGRATVITGSLDYAPVEGEDPTLWVFVAAVVPLAAAFLAWLVLRHRIRPGVATS